MRADNGFSAVELLITLFIGSIFLFAGYQLSAQVSKDGADTTKTATISNLVYDKLRKIRFDDLQGTCDTSSPPSSPANTTQTVAGFKGNVTFQTVYECPFDDIGVYKVTVSATYNDGVATRTLSHAMYSN